MNPQTTVTAHGGNILAIARQRGCRPDQLIDMSSNLTPLGPSRGLLQHLAAHLDQIGYLPETDSATLRRLFAGRHRIPEANILAGNGTTEFIYAIPASLPFRKAVIVTPTYADYFTACAWAQIPTESLAAGPDFRLDLGALAATLKGGELVFLCNPNNPTGALTGSDTLRSFIAGHPETCFVVDESYIAFTHEPSLLDGDLPANCHLLVSYSKVYGIPGLRLGFLVSDADNIRQIGRKARPWGVNRLAQLAGEYLMEHGDAIRAEVLAAIDRERPRLMRGLAAMANLRLIPGSTHFLLCRLTSAMTAATLRERLLDHDIIIRDCANFIGLDGSYFRISLKQRAENDRLLAALATLLA
ncbi:MAG: aminotransferase class I/II-fold pyridoxal phosphate-dependent enzyme [Thermodesulfobacteriota bacterium]